MTKSVKELLPHNSGAVFRTGIGVRAEGDGDVRVDYDKGCFANDCFTQMTEINVDLSHVRLPIGDEWKNHSPEEWGKIQWEQKGCQSCHNIDGTKSKGPSWKGIWGKMEKLNDGKEVLVNADYVRESMMQPQAKIVAGFEPIMPTFQGLLRENEIRGLVAFIKSLK